LWKVDLTFWLHTTTRPHVPDATRLQAITPDQKQTILHLKHTTPGYPNEITGPHIYTAVLTHNIRTPTDLTTHLQNS
jgi:hypothetical protein